MIVCGFRANPLRNRAQLRFATHYAQDSVPVETLSRANPGLKEVYDTKGRVQFLWTIP